MSNVIDDWTQTLIKRAEIDADDELYQKIRRQVARIYRDGARDARVESSMAIDKFLQEIDKEVEILKP